MNRVKALRRGMLVKLKDETGVYQLLDYDKLNRKWSFTAHYGHSCHGGYTDKKNISEIIRAKGGVK